MPIIRRNGQKVKGAPVGNAARWLIQIVQIVPPGLLYPAAGSARMGERPASSRRRGQCKSCRAKLRATSKVTKVTKVTEAIKVTKVTSGYAKKLLQPSVYAALAFDEFYSPNHPYNNSGLRSEYIYTGYCWLRIPLKSYPQKLSTKVTSYQKLSTFYPQSYPHSIVPRRLFHVEHFCGTFCGTFCRTFSAAGL